MCVCMYVCVCVCVCRKVEQLRVEVSSIDRAYMKHKERLAEMVSWYGEWVWRVGGMMFMDHLVGVAWIDSDQGFIKDFFLGESLGRRGHMQRNICLTTPTFAETTPF